MNLLGARQDLFNFRFPRRFIPDEVADKYRPILEKKPDRLLPEPIDYVNFSIQGVNVPGASFDPITQSPNDGTVRYFPNSEPINNIREKQFTVSLKYLDGFINYFILHDTLYYYYYRFNDILYTDDLTLHLYDSSDIATLYFTFTDPIFNSIGELDLNFSDSTVEFSTFDLGFYFNRLAVSIEFNKE